MMNIIIMTVFITNLEPNTQASSRFCDIHSASLVLFVSERGRTEALDIGGDHDSTTTRYLDSLTVYSHWQFRALRHVHESCCLILSIGTSISDC